MSEHLDGSLRVGVPEGWPVVRPEGVALAAVEPRPGRFAPNVTVVVDAGTPGPTVDSAAGVLGSVVALIPIDVRPVDEPLPGVELLFCHLVGTDSVTTLQRQMATDQGNVTVTVSCATADWPRLADLAAEVVSSVEEGA